MSGQQEALSDYLEEATDDASARIAEANEAAARISEYGIATQRATASGDRNRATDLRAEGRRLTAIEKAELATFNARQEERVSSMNEILESWLLEIDSILDATLTVDDFIDLNSQRIAVEHPAFFSKYSAPVPMPAPIVARPEPILEIPEPTGFFGRRKRHAAAVQQSQNQYEYLMGKWGEHVAAIPELQLQQLQRHMKEESLRLEALAGDERVYAEQCAAHIESVNNHNSALEELISGVALKEPWAVEQYFDMVLDRSTYPSGITVSRELEFDHLTHELRVNLTVPEPGVLPIARGYKFVKSTKLIQETAQTLKERRDRYAGLLHQIALRVLHEIFEADRSEVVEAISLSVGTAFIDRRIGHSAFAPLLAVAVSRERLLEIDLSQVLPAPALEGLGAAISKKPYELEAITTTLGVRGH